MPSRHHKSMTVDNLEWPQGQSRGGERGGGRRGDWGGATQPLQIHIQEPAGIEAVPKRLRVEVTSPVSPPPPAAAATSCCCCCCSCRYIYIIFFVAIIYI